MIELELPLNINQYWGKQIHTPMMLVDADNKIVWHNDWSKWLFLQPLENVCIRQFHMGDVLAGYISVLKKDPHAPSIIITVNGIKFEVTGRFIQVDQELVLLRFHSFHLSGASMLEMFRLMQDFALETGDRVNNPLTTVLNCLHMLSEIIPESTMAYRLLELAIRESHTMKGFGDWIRRLSNEPPVSEGFDLPAVLAEALDRRGLNWDYTVVGTVPEVIGSVEHAEVVLGGLINLIKQASGKTRGSIRVYMPADSLVCVHMSAGQQTVNDLRMLAEEFYGGLGLLAARYLLALMQAHLDMDYQPEASLKVTFVPAKNRKL